jgi:hypothetical protein
MLLNMLVLFSWYSHVFQGFLERDLTRHMEYLFGGEW